MALLKLHWAAERQQPVLAYRWWVVAGQPDRAWISSIFFGTASGLEGAWVPGRWREAFCHCLAERRPVWSCREWADPVIAAATAHCGLYALALPECLLEADELGALLSGLGHPQALALVCGTVELAGRVVAHENDGFRAEYARLVSLYGPKPGWVWVLTLSPYTLSAPPPAERTPIWWRLLRRFRPAEPVRQPRLLLPTLLLSAVRVEGVPVEVWSRLGREFAEMQATVEALDMPLSLRVDEEGAPFPALRIVARSTLSMEGIDGR